MSACPACGCASSEVAAHVDVHAQHLVYAGHDRAVALALDASLGSEELAYALHRCTACRLEFAQPLAAPSATWYGILYGNAALYPASRWEYGAVAAQLHANHAVIDYGCGSGLFLESIRGDVRQSIGIDFSSDGVAAARARGLDVRLSDPAYAMRSIAATERADHVVAFHVLEHLSEPQTLFHFARQVGTERVLLWIAVPSDRRPTRLYDEADALDLPPHHLTRWTPEALGALGARSGWTLVSFTHEPLPALQRIWERTRRHALYRLAVQWRPLEWLYRRLLAFWVWLTPDRKLDQASGFSMLACFTPSIASRSR